jgi:hypothetical protein
MPVTNKHFLERVLQFVAHLCQIQLAIPPLLDPNDQYPHHWLLALAAASALTLI